MHLNHDDTLRFVEDIQAQDAYDQDAMVIGFRQMAGDKVMNRQRPFYGWQVDEHVKLIDVAEYEDWDEFLQDLFEIPWPTKTAQDN